MKENPTPLPRSKGKKNPNSMQLLNDTRVKAAVETKFDFDALDALLGITDESQRAEEAPAEPPVQACPPPVEAAPVPQEAPDCTQPAEQSPSGARPPFFKRITATTKGKLLTGGCAVLLLLVLYIAGVLISVAMDPFDNRILANTTVGGIDVGGLTRSEAYRVLKEATASTFSQQSMEVTLPDAVLSLSPELTKVKFHPWAAANEAFRLGRKGTEEEIQAAISAAEAEGTALSMVPHLELDQAYIRSQLEAYALQHNIAYSEVTYQLTGTAPLLTEAGFDESAPGQTLQLTMGTPQVELDVDAVLNLILEAYGSNAFAVTVQEIPPAAVPPEPDLQAIYQEFYIAPVDAGLDMATYVPVAGSYGYAPDLEAAKKLVAGAAYGETVSIPMKYITPEILGDGVYFRDELGFCETPHANNENRTTNLILVCKALDGHIIQPGEEFSYNGVVGERTAEKGYKPAPAYSGIQTVNSIGGGVCQGSSTLYYAALVADLEITERKNHGFRSSYIPIGLDATVSWNGPDFRFVNNTHFPIMIKAEVSDGYMRMWLYGTEERDYYVKLESKITGYTKAETIYRYVSPDSGYRDGEVITGGTDGYYARSYSCKYNRETDELISRDEIALSSYMRVDRVVIKFIEE